MLQQSTNNRPGTSYYSGNNHNSSHLLGVNVSQGRSSIMGNSSISQRQQCIPYRVKMPVEGIEMFLSKRREKESQRQMLALENRIKHLNHED